MQALQSVSLDPQKKLPHGSCKCVGGHGIQQDRRIL